MASDLKLVSKNVLIGEAEQMISAADRISDKVVEACKIIDNHPGKIVISGMGKSGLVGRKISATLASTGTPSYFLHPGEAIHGDLGIVQSKSIIILISYSGETDEILALLPALKRLRVKIIAMTGELNSNLAKNSDIVLNISVDRDLLRISLISFEEGHKSFR